MIFKTFDNKIDKWTAKIGIFGKSFNELGTVVNNAFKSVIDNLDNFDEDVGFWESLKNNLFSKKDNGKDWIKNSLGEVVSKENIDRYIAELDLDSAKEKIGEIFNWSASIKNGDATWSEYFETLKDGTEKYIPDLIKNTNDLSKLTGEDLVKACEQARKATIAHNEEIKNMSFAAKAGQVAFQALATVGNMIAFTLISKGLELAVKGIDNLVHSSERCKERVGELISSYQSTLDTANNNAKTVENLALRYEELSNGVNNLGENIGLTTEEYSEYNNIVNQIADMFPNLIKGYTNEGNAILLLKGNVEQLRDAYKEAQQEAYNTLIISGEDSDGNNIVENFKNATKSFYFFKKLFDLPFHLGSDEISPKVYIESIETLQEKMLSFDGDAWSIKYNEIVNELKSKYRLTENQYFKLKEILSDIGFDKVKFTDEDKRTINNKVKTYIQTYRTELDSALRGVKLLANAYLMTNEDYKNLKPECKNAASIIINSINEEIASGFKKNIDVGNYVENIVNIIKENPEVQDALVGLFKLPIDKFPVSQAKTLIDQYIGTIAEKLKKTPLELKVMLGFEKIDESSNKLKESLQKITGLDQWESIYGNLYNEEIEKDYQDLEEYTKDFTSEETEQWLEVTRYAKTAEEAIEMWKNRALAFPEYALLSEEKIKVIDDYKNKLKELYAALNLLRTGEMSPSDMDEFIAKFPELAMYVDDVDGGIRKLINDTLQLLGKSFKGLTGEDSLKSLSKFSVMQDDVTNSFETTTNAIDTIASIFQIIYHHKILYRHKELETI